MSYKHHTVTCVRKVRWDSLWHVMYNATNANTGVVDETWDRVTEDEALRVARTL